MTRFSSFALVYTTFTWHMHFFLAWITAFLTNSEQIGIVVMVILWWGFCLLGGLIVLFHFVFWVFKVTCKIAISLAMQKQFSFQMWKVQIFYTHFLLAKTKQLPPHRLRLSCEALWKQQGSGDIHWWSRLFQLFPFIYNLGDIGHKKYCRWHLAKHFVITLKITVICVPACSGHMPLTTVTSYTSAQGGKTPL